MRQVRVLLPGPHAIGTADACAMRAREARQIARELRTEGLTGAAASWDRVASQLEEVAKGINEELDRC